ncbi:MAG: DUF494 family protein [Bacillota bacterium]
MNERVMEILNFVLLITHDKKYNEHQLKEDLMAKGFNVSDIDTALGLILSIPEPAQSKDQGALYFRVFSPLERIRIPLEVQERILHYQGTGLITPPEMEMLLMEMMAMDGEISDKDMDELIMQVVKDESRLMMILPAVANGFKYFAN